MFKLYQRYLASHFIPPFLLSTFFFVTFLLTFQLFRITKIVINKGVEWTTVAELMGHIAVSFLPMAIPLSALFATIYTLNKLSEDSEIVAMRSFGITKFNLFLPFLIIGVLISLGIFSLNQKLIPYSKTKFKNTIIRLTSRGMVADIKAGQFFTEIPGVTLFAENVIKGGSKLENVFIEQKAKDGNTSVVVAKKGTLIKLAADEWGVPTLRMHLVNGNIVKSYKNDSEFEKIIFGEYDFPILVGGVINQYITKDSMRTNKELSHVIKKRESEIDKLSKNFENNKNKIGSLIKVTAKSKLEFWSRFNTPLQCLIFILLGFSLGIKKGRGRTKNTGVLGVIVLVSYYALFFTGVSLSRKGVIPPFLTVFVPTLIAFGFGSFFYKKLDWAS